MLTHLVDVEIVLYPLTKKAEGSLVLLGTEVG